MNSVRSTNFLSGNPTSDKATALVEKFLEPNTEQCWLLYNTGSYLAKGMFAEIEHICVHDLWQDHWECEKSDFSSFHGWNQEDRFLFPPTHALLRADKSTEMNFKAMSQIFSKCAIDTLLIYGENNLGIKGLQKKIGREFSECECLTVGNNSRILEVKRPESLPIQSLSKTVSYHLAAEETVEIQSVPGIFGHGKIDKGTQLLLENLPDLANQKVIDIGCGAGPIAKAALQLGAKLVSATDSSAIAIEQTEQNLRDFEEDRLDIFPAFLAGKPAKGPYDVVLTNPPFHQQKERRLDFPNAWAKKCSQVLRYKGQLFLVANKFLPYEEALAPHFHFVEVLTEDKEFVVFRAVK